MQFLCQHDLFIYNPNVDNTKDAFYTYATAEQFEFLKSQYSISGNVISFSKVKVDDAYFIESFPKVCDECRLKRLLDYAKATITVVLTDLLQLSDPEEAEKILEHRVKGGDIQYRVRWINAGEDTWETVNAIRNQEIINAYWEKLETKKPEIVDIDSASDKESDRPTKKQRLDTPQKRKGASRRSQTRLYEISITPKMTLFELQEKVYAADLDNGPFIDTPTLSNSQV